MKLTINGKNYYPQFELEKSEEEGVYIYTLKRIQLSKDAFPKHEAMSAKAAALVRQAMQAAFPRDMQLEILIDPVNEDDIDDNFPKHFEFTASIKLPIIPDDSAGTKNAKNQERIEQALHYQFSNTLFDVLRYYQTEKRWKERERSLLEAKKIVDEQQRLHALRFYKADLKHYVRDNIKILYADILLKEIGTLLKKVEAGEDNKELQQRLANAVAKYRDYFERANAPLSMRLIYNVCSAASDGFRYGAFPTYLIGLISLIAFVSVLILLPALAATLLTPGIFFAIIPSLVLLAGLAWAITSTAFYLRATHQTNQKHAANHLLLQELENKCDPEQYAAAKEELARTPLNNEKGRQLVERSNKHFTFADIERKFNRTHSVKLFKEAENGERKNHSGGDGKSWFPSAPKRMWR
jgi:hypothetical protein